MKNNFDSFTNVNFNCYNILKYNLCINGPFYLSYFFLRKLLVFFFSFKLSDSVESLTVFSRDINFFYMMCERFFFECYFALLLSNNMSYKKLIIKIDTVRIHWELI